MGREQNTTIVQQCFAYASHGDRAGLQRILSPDFVIHTPEDHRGVDGLLEMVEGFRRALPDLTVTVDEQFADDDHVASRFTLRGTHEGEIMGVPPSGRQVVLQGIAMSHCQDGRIVEEWELVDVARLLAPADPARG